MRLGQRCQVKRGGCGEVPLPTARRCPRWRDSFEAQPGSTRGTKSEVATCTQLGRQCHLSSVSWAEVDWPRRDVLFLADRWPSPFAPGNVRPWRPSQLMWPE